MKKAIILLFCVAGWAQQPTKRIVFEAPETYPEGIAYEKPSNSFFVSSARLGKVGKVSMDGKYSEFYADKSLKSTYGIKVHPDGKRLYVCAGDANYSKFSTAATKKKEARLLILDIKSGKKISDIDLSQLVQGEHFPNDLAFDTNGDAYITDSFSNAVYKVDVNGKASIFSQHELLKAAGVGPNGIVFNSGGFLLVANNGTGSLVKIPIADPSKASKVQIGQFFPGADGLVMDNGSTLTMVQNGGADKIFKIVSSDGWSTATVSQKTSVEDRFAFPSTATLAGKDIWVMNANFSELAEGNNVPSTEFSIQLAVFRTAEP